MNKYFFRLIGLTLSMMSIVACEEELSPIGEGIQPKSDVVESEKYFLQFEASTERSNTIYSGSSPSALLGAYSDATYGDFKADFATQFRTGVGLKFDPMPQSGQIDSVTLQLILPNSQNGAIGSRTAVQEFAVYELPKDFVGSETSEATLTQYATQDRLLTKQTVTLKDDRKTLTLFSGGDQRNYSYINLKLTPEVGQRIYAASTNTPEMFATQESFNKNVFSGVYVTTSAGRGFVIQVSATVLKLHYHYLDKEGKVQTTSKDFINTKLTAKRNGLSNTEIDALLKPDAKYSYNKGPAGVIPAIRLPKEQLERLLAKQGPIEIGTNWTLADTQLDIKVENPDHVLLNPPTNMMLMPKDLVETYFRSGQTQRTAYATSYLSTNYNSQNKHYNFFNISRLITKHLQEHAKYEAGHWRVAKDLELRLLPVLHIATTNPRDGSSVTIGIEEYLFPNFVRLKTGAEDLRIGVVASIFK